MSGQAKKPPGRFVRSGKVKDIYDLDPEHLLFHFTDRVSAFDVVLPTTIPQKGEALCKMGAYWFETLGVPHHMVRLEGLEHDGRQEDQHDHGRVRREGVPLRESLREDGQGRGLASCAKVLAAKLPEPFFDPTTKSEVHDEPITEEQIIERGPDERGRAKAGEGHRPSTSSRRCRTRLRAPDSSSPT